MPLDAQGIHQYVGSELAAPADVMLNRLAGSTSTQVGALRERTVQAFASAAARTAAVLAPREGQLTWLEDINMYQYWSGSAWLTMPPPQQGGLFQATSAANGTVTLNHGIGRTPAWCIATLAAGGTDNLNLIMTPVIWTLNATQIIVGIRREDTHQWFPGQPVSLYIQYGLALGAVLLPADQDVTQ
jgi:hypothetical protein